MTRSPTIILTADETMMSNYRGGMFLGFSTCAPRGILPDWLFFMAFAPPVPRKKRRAVYADLGLRTLEAALLAYGFGEDEVAVLHPRDLRRVVGKETEIVAIGGHDLLGINPPTSTFVDIARTGPPYNRLKFLELMRNPALKKVTTIVGGKGAWQVANETFMDKLGIDHVHLGMGEISMPGACRAIIHGEEVPRIIQGKDVPVERIPAIRGASIHGLVEISRGCGRGCAFCTPGMLKVLHKPIDQIVGDVRVNVLAGNTAALLHSEDTLRYGSKTLHAEPEKVMELFSRVAAVRGVTGVACSHIALATAYHHPDLIDRLSEFLMSLPEQRFIGAQTGIETASARLMQQYMHGKPLPAKPEEWRDLVVESVGHLSDNNWVLACTMVVGLPGETEDDVLQTLDLVDDLKGMSVFLVPMNFVAMGDSTLSREESFTVEKMTPAHWRLVGACMEHDVRLARMMRDSIIAGNPLIKRLGYYTSDRLIGNAEEFAGKIRDGNPPRDYAACKENFLVPEF
jgi:radical SAM superfamily enzyme YgiQ (UPF0313 family)